MGANPSNKLHRTYKYNNQGYETKKKYAKPLAGAVPRES